ncbi:MAG: TetR/AcrR family transcriptional regulator [Bacteroidota bacterium]|nr:TetR/AcrR family transcriptional regulator [Bacteroidota bacterium]
MKIVVRSMKQLILEKATEGFITYGFKSFTTDDLVHQMGISKKTLYGYFKSKDILIGECLYFIISNVNSCYSILKEGNNIIEDVFDKMEQMAMTFKITNNRPVWELKKYYPKIYQKFAPRFKNLDYNYIEQLITRGLKEKVFREDIDLQFVQAFYHGMQEVRQKTEIYPEDQFNIWKVITYHNIYLLRILCNPKGIEILEKIILEKNLKS